MADHPTDILNESYSTDRKWCRSCFPRYSEIKRPTPHEASASTMHSDLTGGQWAPRAVMQLLNQQKESSRMTLKREGEKESLQS